jgi:hypothetical protein
MPYELSPPRIYVKYTSNICQIYVKYMSNICTLSGKVGTPHKLALGMKPKNSLNMKILTLSTNVDETRDEFIVQTIILLITFQIIRFTKYCTFRAFIRCSIRCTNNHYPLQASNSQFYII